MAAQEYWIWLLRTLGSTVKANVLVKHYGNAQNLYLAGKEDWLASGLLTENEAAKLAKYSPSQSYDVLKACEENSWHIIPFDSEYYPPRLREIKDAPLVLFAHGNKELLKSSPVVAMVGTRDASDKACVAAYRLSMFLSRSDVTVISGGALGIDRCAHEGALEAGCKTVAVLGSGLGSDYLSSLKSMRERIKNNGVLITEMLPGEAPTRYSFPRRNRIISGMSDGVIVIEADKKSGSLITASHAYAQNRKVFVLSQSVVPSAGCRQLIEDKNACEIEAARDVLVHYEHMLSPKAFENKYLDTPPAQGNPQDSYITRVRNMNDISYRKEFFLPMQEKDSEKKEKTEKTQNTKKNPVAKATQKQIINTDVNEQKKECPEPVLPDDISADARAVFSVLTSDGVYPDEIQLKTNLGLNRILAAITELELSDLAVLLAGNKVAKI